MFLGRKIECFDMVNTPQISLMKFQSKAQQEAFETWQSDSNAHLEEERVENCQENFENTNRKIWCIRYYNVLSSYSSQNSMILGKNGWEVMESFEINLSIYDILTFGFFSFFFFSELCGLWDLNSLARDSGIEPVPLAVEAWSPLDRWQVLVFD